MANLNNWMQAATTKLTAISNSVAAQYSVTVEPQVPLSVEETLKKILENQKTITDTLVAHRKVIEDLSK